MARIDAHHHLWDLSSVHYPWLMAKGVRRFFGDPTPIQRNYLVDEFKGDAGRHGFEGSVHIQVGAEDPMAEAEWVQSVAEKTPGWPAAQVVYCDLRDAAVDARLDAYGALSTVKGVRQIVGRSPEEDAQSGAPSLLDDPRFLDGLRALPERGLSFDLQLTPELMLATAECLSDIPDLSVALCHAGSLRSRDPGLMDIWREGISALAACPGVVCKLSGQGMFVPDWTAEDLRPVVETCLDAFGAGRCMFGSNFPVDSLAGSYADLIAGYEAVVPETDWPAVFGGTARRFYGL